MERPKHFFTLAVVLQLPFLTLVNEANQLLQIQYHSHHLPIKKKQFPHFSHKLETFHSTDVRNNVTTLYKERPYLKHLTKYWEMICDTSI